MRMRDDDQAITLLLTGFGPFPGVKDNASARLVEHLAPLARETFSETARERPQHRDSARTVAGRTSEPQALTIHAAILPTEWQRAPDQLRALIDHHRPDVSLHFGVAHDAKGFRIETRAANACRLEHDAAGLRPAAAFLRDGAAPFRHATIPINAIVTRLTTMGLPAYPSNDAGAYLCNAVLYHALDAAAAWTPKRAGFIHIPDQLDGPPLTFDGALQGALEIVRVCVGRP